MKKLLAIAMASFLIASCTDGDEAQRALDNLGMTEIKITGYRFFGCGKDDGWHTGFSAKNMHGKIVTGVVCSGVLKGATVRID